MTSEQLLLGLASIAALGMGAQWIAWKLRIPSILLLLTVGFLAGPITGFLRPNDLLGDLIFPIVSLSVGIILFEGALSLRLSEIRTTGNVVRNLITVGALVTFVLSALGAFFILGLPLGLAVLFGSILVVTGPTVIMPLLRHIRPIGRVGSILRWEGILIDPVGALMAVLVFEAIAAGETHGGALPAMLGSFLEAFAVGGLLGALGAGLVMLLLSLYLMPDYLENPITLAIVVSVFAASNVLVHESGLVATTLMGVILANQRKVTVHHIIEFKENLGVLLLAGLFIILSARVRLESLLAIDALRGLGFLAFMVFITRPATVLISSYKSTLGWREKLFLMAMAPRGIVAASVASLFAFRLIENGRPEAEVLTPLMFLVIIGTVTIYGLGGGPLARRLGLAQANPQGTLILGAHPLARAIAHILQGQGVEVVLVDSNRDNVEHARSEHLRAVWGNILEEEVQEHIEFERLGRFLALTSNDEINALASVIIADQMGRAEVYQLPPRPKQEREQRLPKHLRGRLLFHDEATFSYLTERLLQGDRIAAVPLSSTLDVEQLQREHGLKLLPLFLLTAQGVLQPITRRTSPAARPGQLLIAMLDPALELPVDQEQRLHLQAAGHGFLDDTEG